MELITRDGYKVKIVHEDKNRCIIYCKENGYMRGVNKWDMPGNIDLLINGIGYIKTDDISDLIGVAKNKAYSSWVSMIKRVYPSLPNKNYNAYNNVSICEQWLDFKVFEKWYKENYVEGYELDKDLLSDPANKMYSPETCCFIPRSLNCRTNINENVVKKNGKYGFMDIYNTKGKRFVPFNSISEAKRAKRMYHQIWVLSTLDVHKDKINKKIKTKIVSLYENYKQNV